MSESVLVVNNEKAIVRIHAGKRTAEERKAVIEKAATEFYWAIEKSKKDGVSNVHV